MREEQQAAILIGLVFLIGVAGLFLIDGLSGVSGSSQTSFSLGDVYVDSYRADLYPNGTLSEQFVYQIGASGKYRMLYRNWKMPLSVQNLSTPYVQPLAVEVPKGTTSYFKESSGNVTIFSPAQRLYQNEVESWPRETR
jgi:uncharacterized membrane protein